MKLRTSLLVAGIINSGFETGINPAWFEVKSLNKDGFLDAAFAEGKLPTPSKKEARADWSFEARMNGDEVDSDEEADSPWTIVTAKKAIAKFKRYVKKEKSDYAKLRVHKLLFAIGISETSAVDSEVEYIMSSFDFDGVDSDCFAQIAICGDVIYG